MQNNVATLNVTGVTHISNTRPCRRHAARMLITICFRVMNCDDALGILLVVSVATNKIPE